MFCIFLVCLPAITRYHRVSPGITRYHRVSLNPVFQPVACGAPITRSGGQTMFSCFPGPRLVIAKSWQLEFFGIADTDVDKIPGIGNILSIAHLLHLVVTYLLPFPVTYLLHLVVIYLLLLPVTYLLHLVVTYLLKALL
jgi:hypothetical protein